MVKIKSDKPTRRYFLHMIRHSAGDSIHTQNLVIQYLGIFFLRFFNGTLYCKYNASRCKEEKGKTKERERGVIIRTINSNLQQCKQVSMDQILLTSSLRRSLALLRAFQTFLGLTALGRRG